MPYDEAIAYRKKKIKRRGIIALASICIIIAFLLLAPSIMEWLRSPSERYILNSNDLGDEWQVIGPSKSQNDKGVIDTAHVSLYSTLAAGSCYLLAHSSYEAANASYEKIIAEFDTSSIEYTYSSADVLDVDTAVVYTSMESYSPNTTRTLIFEKGTWVGWIQLHGKDPSGLDPTILTDMAQVQVAKLP